MKASPIRCLVSAGPTREFFDPVRFLSNPSSGKMGFALAGAAAERGWEVDLVSGPVNLATPPGVRRHEVVTGAEMKAALERLFPDCSILLMTAAIMDYRPKHRAAQKVKKHDLAKTLEMEPVPDVVAGLAADRTDQQLLVGFAAETEKVEAYARSKLEKKGVDFIVANRIGGEESAFGSDTNRVLVLGNGGIRHSFGPSPKTQLAATLLDWFAPWIPGSEASASR
ncbi:MAG: hypothetical protein GVY10_09580 [Verrucomicrobia bacterium]|jgi:phosphopantothenoylcysteine decarboxylase/phosphopantothenate--cysteine ligase|nr:hypothetical protein [Verrucomicrobiota bacterium]